MHVAGVIVQTRPEDLERVKGLIHELEGADIHGTSAEGKLVVTLLGESRSAVADSLFGLGRVDGILVSTLVYEESDSDFFAEGPVQ